MRSMLIVLLLVCTSCFSIPTVQKAKLSYSTVQAPWPADTACLNPPERSGIAKEVLMGSQRTVVIAGGPSPISDTAWETYSPSLGNKKNSDRHLLFERSCFSRSPSSPADCQGEACREVQELDGHTWVSLSKIHAWDCIPSVESCSNMAARPGGLLVVVTSKCHRLQFEREVLMLSGPQGERAVMHATNDGVPTTDVRLPQGWTLRRETLDTPLVLFPFGGEGKCFYNIIRDEKLQSYHQLAYPREVWP